jgi:hypothetical protein
MDEARVASMAEELQSGTLGQAPPFAAFAELPRTPG